MPRGCQLSLPLSTADFKWHALVLGQEMMLWHPLVLAQKYSQAFSDVRAKPTLSSGRFTSTMGTERLRPRQPPCANRDPAGRTALGSSLLDSIRALRMPCKPRDRYIRLQEASWSELRGLERLERLRFGFATWLQWISELTSTGTTAFAPASSHDILSKLCLDEFGSLLPAVPHLPQLRHLTGRA